MDEDKLADLNDIQDFFNRSHSTSASGTFCTESIGIKDFIGWCNDPCKNTSENSPHSDPAYKLGNTVLKLKEFNENKLKEMESALKEDRWDEWCKDNRKKVSADDAVFYLVLKCRTDDQRHYHFYFDKDAVAELDAFDPFTEDENGKKSFRSAVARTHLPARLPRCRPRLRQRTARISLPLSVSHFLR